MGFLKSVLSLGQQAGAAFANVVERLANRSEFEGVMAAVVLVAAADGKISNEEQSAAVGLLKTHPAFAPFDSKDIDRIFKENAGLIGADAEFGREALYDKVRGLSVEARMRVTAIALQIANADGTVDDSERAVITKLRAL